MCTRTKNTGIRMYGVVLHHMFCIAMSTSVVKGWPFDCELHGIIHYLDLLGVPTCESYHRLRTMYR